MGCNNNNGSQVAVWCVVAATGLGSIDCVHNCVRSEDTEEEDDDEEDAEPGIVSDEPSMCECWDELCWLHSS